jgi:SulP family sulfate permease
VEWCEDALLGSLGAVGDETARPLQEQLAQLLTDAHLVPRLLSYCERQEYAPGHYLVRQGDPADDLFFVESGQVTAHVERSGHEPLRLQTMQGGHVVGELGFYLRRARTAAVVVDRPSTIYRLSRQRLAHMAAHDPEVAAGVHQLVACLLAERAIHLMTAIGTLQR